MSTPAIVLVAHGSRDPLWQQPIDAIAERIRARDPHALVRCAYLELCPPTLDQVTTDLIAAGADSIKVLPIFFGLGQHMQLDLPVRIAQVQAQHPQVPIELLPSAGQYPQLLNLMAEIALSSTRKLDS